MPNVNRYVHVLFAIYVLGVLVLMFAPVPAIPSSVPSGADKLVHVGVFFGFGALLYWDRRAALGADALLPGAVSFATAALVELIQAVLPYRTGDFWDFAAGALGALAGLFLARRLRLPRTDA